MTIYNQHGGDNSGTGPSPAIWASADVLQAYARPDKAVYLFDDFLSFDGLVTSTVGKYASDSGAWISYEDSGDSIVQLETEIGGVIRLQTDGTDNDEVWLANGGAKSVLGKIPSTGGNKMWFECRVRPQEIATRNFYIGLAEEGLAAADTIADAGTLASKDLLGFASLEGDATGLDTVHRTAGQALTTVQDDIETLVAATWYKLGWIFDPDAPAAKRIRFFNDGVEQSSYVTATALAAATFPSGEEMGILMGIKNGTTTITRLDVDWVRFLQLRD